jgi:hypothetical protein
MANAWVQFIGVYSQCNEIAPFRRLLLTVLCIFCFVIQTHQKGLRKWLKGTRNDRELIHISNPFFKILETLSSVFKYFYFTSILGSFAFDCDLNNVNKYK